MLGLVSLALGIIMEKYRICRKCKIHHYENCGSCFGFGFYSPRCCPGKLYLVTALEAHDGSFDGEIHPCPECGSIVAGLPNKPIEPTAEGGGS